MIHLAWVRYVVKNQPKMALMVSLGSDNSKYYALKAGSIPPAEIMLIRKSLKKISALPLNERVVWLKQSCPESYKYAFRSLPAGKVIEIRKYDIGELVDEMQKPRS